jgi:hypothetical protein
MIARIWCGSIPTSKSNEYADVARTTLPRYVETRGNRAAWYLYRNETDVTRSLMITLWEDVDAIVRLAGIAWGSPAGDLLCSGGLREPGTGVQQYEVHSDSRRSPRDPKPTPSLEWS